MPPHAVDVEQLTDTNRFANGTLSPTGFEVNIGSRAGISSSGGATRDACRCSGRRTRCDRPHQREHVTPIFYERPDLFRILSVAGAQDYSSYRWTLDTPEDIQLIRAIYSHFDNRDDFGWREAITLMEDQPELATMNSHIVQKAVAS